MPDSVILALTVTLWMLSWWLIGREQNRQRQLASSTQRHTHVRTHSIQNHSFSTGDPR